MKRSAWAAMMLGLFLWVPQAAHAQEDPQNRSAGLGRNYPNPFNPETTIPFTLNEELWEGGDNPVVSLRIYNVLAQLVAIPVLLGGSGEPLADLALEWNGTGRFEAYWNGHVLDSDREAASGVYVYQLIVNGRRVGSQKMTIIK